MTTRREVLRCGLALPALSLAAGSLPFTASAVGAAETLRLERFVYDVRFAESAAMGEHAARRGISPAPIADDLMRIWYDDLDLRWREQPMALAGITMAEALFVLETFALDRGMHVVYRGEHSVVEQGRMAHRLAGPTELLEAVRPLPTEWQAPLCAALAQCPLGKPPSGTAEYVTTPGGLSLREVPLQSWIIAPRAAVATMIPR
jgi:hypothetical protein